MKTYKCQYCNYKIDVNKNKKGVHSPKYIMGKHYEEKHKSLLPPHMSGYRWFYFLLTKKEKGSCVICHNETEFNEISMKYSRFCNNPQCKQKYKEERDNRMIAKYGKISLLNDPEHQKKMQQGRRIAGVYLWSDGKTKIPYLSSYEEDFFRHLDRNLNWPAGDILAPSPHNYTYKYKDKDHFYIPDAFIPSLNLEIEIKSSIRQEKQNPESRDKEIIKDQLMKSCSNLFNYIKIDDKNYEEFNKIIQQEGDKN
jgi:hypothetical protein